MKLNDSYKIFRKSLSEVGEKWKENNNKQIKRWVQIQYGRNKDGSVSAERKT